MPIPNFRKKLDQEVIISPRQHLMAEKEEYDNFVAPQAVIFCYEEYIMEYVQKQYAVESKRFWTCDIHYFSDTDNEVAIVGNFGIGGPASCHLLEILIAAGVENYVMLGHCGGLQKSNAVGTIVLCEKAIRDEGLSYHYLADGQFAYPSGELTKVLQEELQKRKAKFVRGSTWTIDSMYRETIDEIRHYEKEGVATVEMEAASMFAVAQFREVKIAGLFVVSDLVTFEEWKEYLHAKDTTNAIIQTLTVAKDVLSERP